MQYIDYNNILEYNYFKYWYFVAFRRTQTQNTEYRRKHKEKNCK